MIQLKTLSVLQVVMSKTFLKFSPSRRRVILEYAVDVRELDPASLDSGFGNYSLAGIEIMLQRFELTGKGFFVSLIFNSRN